MEYLYTFFGGFVAGSIFSTLVYYLLYKGKIKSLSIGSFKIEGHLESASASTESPDDIQFDVPAPGRWFSKKDNMQVRWKESVEVARTPATVTMKKGEVYRFAADFSIKDEEFVKLLPLAQFPQLQNLALWKCKFLHEPALCQLKEFKYLMELDVVGTNMTDKVLDAISSVTSLKKIQLSKASASRDALRRLRSALPACEIKEVEANGDGKGNIPNSRG